MEVYYDPKLIRNLRNKLEVSAVFLHNQGIVGESPQAQQQSAKSPENPAIRIDMTLTQQEVYASALYEIFWES